MFALFLIAVVVFILLLRKLQRRVDQLEAAVNRILDLERIREISSEEVIPTRGPTAAAAPIDSFGPTPPQPSPAPPPAVAPQPPAWAEPETITGTIRALWKRLGLAGVEWEAVIGGSWLNKLGVLVFVIGLALFVG